MRAVSITKKQIKRIAAITAAAAATAAVIITAAVTSVGTKAEQRKLPIYRVERADNKIAVTFDVAWENSNTDELLDILSEYDAKATFFITGDWCDRYPDDVKKFADAGHEIENHSDQHPHVEGINVNDLINDTRECSRKIKMITGKEPVLYRAPYGEYDDSLLTTLEGMGLKTIQWDVEPNDTDGIPLAMPFRRAWGIFGLNFEHIVADIVRLAKNYFNIVAKRKNVWYNKRKIQKVTLAIEYR